MAETERKEEDKKQRRRKKIKQGGLRTMPFILANEVCNRFATDGFNTNMITYLTQQLHMPIVQASNTLTIFTGTAGVTPLIGGLVSDSFAGRFWTIIAGSLIYQLGMLLLTFSAVLPSLRPPPCDSAAVASPSSLRQDACRHATPWQLLVLYVSLLLTSIGTGGVRPCVVAFGADQVGLDAPKVKQRKWDFFNLYFFWLKVAEVAAATLPVYVQDNVGWGWGLGIPTIVMLVSVVVFFFGYPLYVMVRPSGSPLTRLTQVVVAAFRKRKVVKPEDPGELYENKEMDAEISTAGRLLHTNQLRFFDRAAIVCEGDVLDSGEPRQWRLSTVHRVEELKSLLRMMPIWAVGILIAMSASHNFSFAVLQARTMDRRLAPHFQIPPASMTIFSPLTMLISITIYDRAFVPLARRITGRRSGITYFQRIGAGLTVGLFANVAAALVEARRKRVATENGLLDSPRATLPMSVLWLLPQYAIHGLSEAFTSAGKMEFLYEQSPESMRSTAAALFWLASAVGNYLSTLMVWMLHEYTKRKNDWLQDNINRGKLDYYYWMVTGLQVMNLGYFVVCTMLYTFKPLEVVGGGEEEGSGSGGGSNGGEDGAGTAAAAPAAEKEARLEGDV